MYLARKLFGEILPYRMNHPNGYIPVKGGLAHDQKFFEADHVTLSTTDDGRLRARVHYSGEIPQELHSPTYGSAKWFHDHARLELRITMPDDFYRKMNVKIIQAPDYFLNDAGRPEPYPPQRQEGTRSCDYLVEVTEACWWSSDEHSAGFQWYFSINDLPELPPIRESDLCQANRIPGTYPGAYFTCFLNSHRDTSQSVEYWFSYELESNIDRSNSFHENRPIITRNQYRFSFGRTDKQELDLNEGHRIVHLWEYLLGFCSGAFRTFDIIIGYSDTGGWCYFELPRAVAKQSPCKFSWFPQEWPLDFPAFACQFLTHFQLAYDQRTDNKGVPVQFFDPALHPQHGPGAPIPVLDGYLRAASLELPHDSINAAFAALETQVKEHFQLPDTLGLPPGKIPEFLQTKGVMPGSRSRSFGSHANASWQSPKDIAGLKNQPEGQTGIVTIRALLPEYKPRTKAPDQSDEEYGIADIKNWRDKRASHFDGHAGGGHFHDAQNYSNLTLEYLELVILQRVGYSGIYRSRTGMFKQAVKPVPWGETAKGSNS